MLTQYFPFVCLAVEKIVQMQARGLVGVPLLSMIGSGSVVLIIVSLVRWLDRMCDLPACSPFSLCTSNPSSYSRPPTTKTSFLECLMRPRRMLSVYLAACLHAPIGDAPAL